MEHTLKERLLEVFTQHDLAAKSAFIGLEGFRNTAFETFKAKGFPGRKHEEYRFLNFEPLFKPAHEIQPVANTLKEPAYPEWDKDCFRIVVINGQLIRQWSNLDGLPSAITIGSLQEALEMKNVKALAAIGTLASNDDDPFVALNSALFNQGVFIHIPDKVTLDKPLHLYITNQGNTHLFTQPRILVIAGKQANASLIQHFATATLPASFTNSLCEVQADEDANITMYCVQNEEENQSLVNTIEAHISKFCNFKTVTVTLGGKLVRNNLNVVLDSAECEAHLYGYYHPKNQQTFDNHTLVDHKFPHCNSNELYKGVVEEGGHAVFNGKVFVRKDAQKTNAFQNNKNILLSDDATVNTKPQLEIYADDVKCSHGSSTGYLDPEQLFYLRSRGISLEKARALLLKAYAAEVLDQIELESLHQHLSEQIEAINHQV
ncbi:MAG: Fe-S cluster assembly protein SufD [Bacteroidia bacterium]|nr:Fe-S cluster assembly protein SufD [Bacteroidia bacterium]